MFNMTFVCLGNICRSPMAHVVMEAGLVEAGLDDAVSVTSSGTGSWHTGGPIDPRAGSALSARGYDSSAHIARQFTRDWYAEHDLILTMDASNHADVTELSPTVEDRKRVRMFREFDPEAGDDLDVPDPWFGEDDGFEHVLTMVERTVDGIITRLPELLERR